MDMFIVHSTIVVPLDKVSEVISIYRQRSGRVDTWPGFLSFQLLQNEHRPEELTVQLTWQDKDSYLAWARSEDFRRVHELEKHYPDADLRLVRPTVRKYQVVAE
ncbi:heme-degrading monooxygenase HmoA [Alicyclobacillus sacchari]|uniref:Heme-degrading monooxygenase HmoA n=2 Tax=Alicyclobacillus sacchari TaxID=392010 RepID=A0A4R8LKI8_9BACL|nr:heme-degrading monooxygenase HmoA [Alicyclobacillus sacchari]